MYELRSGSRRDGGQSDLSTRKGAIRAVENYLFQKDTDSGYIAAALGKLHLS